MTCDQYAPLLSLYHDGMLEPAQREEVRAHLHGCAACAERLAVYRRLDRQVARAMQVRPSARFTRTVLAATGDRDIAWARAARRRRSARRRAQMLLGGVTGASAAGLIALVLGIAASLSPAHTARPATPVHRSPTSIPVTAESPARQPDAGVARFIAPADGSGVLRRPGTQVRVTTVPLSVAKLESGLHGVTLGAPARPSGDMRAASGLAEATAVRGGTAPDRAASLRLADDEALRGAAIDPLWSWDSRSLLYLTDWHPDPRSGWMVGSLMRYAPDGTLRLHDLVRDFAWSPDDHSIIYTAQAPGVAAASARAQDLHIVRADGTGDRILCRVDRASVEYLSGHITAVQQGRLVAIDPVTGASAPLDHMPAVRIASADAGFWALSSGERFFAYQDSAGLRVWDRALGGKLVLRDSLARFGQASFHFSWDGRQIFYSTFAGEHTRLYRRTLDPLGAPVPLAGGRSLRGPIVQVGAPSPDGSLLNYRIGQNNTAVSYVVDTLHGPPHVILPPGDAGVGPVGSWSPDGTRFVYTIYRGDAPMRSAIARVTR